MSVNVTLNTYTGVKILWTEGKIRIFCFNASMDRGRWRGVGDRSNSHVKVMMALSVVTFHETFFNIQSSYLEVKITLFYNQKFLVHLQKHASNDITAKKQIFRSEVNDNSFNAAINFSSKHICSHLGNLSITVFHFSHT